jgi:hypothetical protein
MSEGIVSGRDVEGEQESKKREKEGKKEGKERRKGREREREKKKGKAHPFNRGRINGQQPLLRRA